MMIKTLAMAAMMAAATATSAPLDLLLKDPAKAAAFDYHALRDDAGNAALKTLLDQVPVPANRCLTEAEAEVRAGALSAVDEASSQDWLDDQALARVAQRRFAQTRDALLAGQPAIAPGLNANLAGFIKAAKTARSPEAKELLTRTAQDQIALHYPIGDMTVTPGADTRLAVIAEREACLVWRGNTQWLKTIVARRGWFTTSRDGEEADKAAWLIVQHSDHDPAFQEQVLLILEGLRAKGDTNPRNYAYLYDRVADNAGRKQRFATQGRCVGPGDWQPFPVEDQANIEAIRKQAGLPPLSEYRTWFGCK